MSTIEIARVKAGDGGAVEVAVMRLRAGRGNAMSVALLGDLAAAAGEIRAGTARAVVVTGDGGFFSAGLALPDLIDLDRATLRGFMGTFTTAMRAVLELPVPVVAAINGHAIAGGCVLALMCDVRIAAAGGAKIGLNEVALGIGLPAVVVEPLRLRVPPSSMVPIALGGGLFGPDPARALGLVDEVVDAGALEARAIARAAELGAGGRAAAAQVKAAILAPTLAAIERRAEAEREAWLDSWFSDDAQARLRAAVARLRR